MAAKIKIAVVVGSLRKGSFNRMSAKALIELAPEGVEFEMIEIGDLPLFDQDADDEERPFPEWQRFRDQIRSVDAVLFVTPEYNRSVPGVLKNAIDIASRPYGQNVWAGKPAALMSVSSGAIGGFGANHHLRQSLVFVDMVTMPQPEAYISYAAKLFDADGKLTNDDTRAFFKRFIDSFVAWIERVK